MSARRDPRGEFRCHSRRANPRLRCDSRGTAAAGDIDGKARGTRHVPDVGGLAPRPACALARRRAGSCRLVACSAARADLGRGGSRHLPPAERHHPAKRRRGGHLGNRMRASICRLSGADPPGGFPRSPRPRKGARLPPRHGPGAERARCFGGAVSPCISPRRTFFGPRPRLRCPATMPYPPSCPGRRRA